MHLALKAYQELLATVNEMDMSPDEAVRESSRIIKSEAFPLLNRSLILPRPGVVSPFPIPLIPSRLHS